MKRQIECSGACVRVCVCACVRGQGGGDRGSTAARELNEGMPDWARIQQQTNAGADGYSDGCLADRGWMGWMENDWE